MVVISRDCSVCSTPFEVHFRYQMEEREEIYDNGKRAVRFAFYCSQRCLEASHRERIDGSVSCDGCACRFEVELASHVLFTGGKRHYACGQECRARILSGARSIRLGQLLDPVQAEAVEGEASPEAANDSILPPAPSSESRRRNTAAPGSPRVLAVFNHKGGTGKTTTAVQVSAGLAARGERVLLVDADGQGNVAASFGLSFERSLYHVVVMGLAVEQAVTRARPNLDILPANETLAAAELYLAGQKNRDRVLRNRLDRARELYDYVVIDCSPSLSLMNQNALVMADAVLCPVACDYLSLVGIRQVLRTVKHVNRMLGHPVGIWGVLPTMFDTRARICREALETLRRNFRDVCLPPIHFVSRVKEAPSVGKTLFEHAPGSTATEDYWRVVDRLLDSGGAHDHETLALKAGGVG
jgi:chromosome partitioning protein